MAVQFITNLHLAAPHWTVKKGKPSGRPIGDMTYVTGTPLNTLEATAEAASMYGDIEHPRSKRFSRWSSSSGHEHLSASLTPSGKTSDYGKWISR